MCFSRLAADIASNAFQFSGLDGSPSNWNLMKFKQILLVEFPSSHPAILRKCIELIPPERLGFLLAEMHGHAVAAARHRYGDLVQWDCYGVVQFGVVDLGDSNEWNSRSFQCVKSCLSCRSCLIVAVLYWDIPFWRHLARIFALKVQSIDNSWELQKSWIRRISAILSLACQPWHQHGRCNNKSCWNTINCSKRSYDFVNSWNFFRSLRLGSFATVIEAADNPGVTCGTCSPLTECPVGRVRRAPKRSWLNPSEGR